MREKDYSKFKANLGNKDPIARNNVKTLKIRVKVGSFLFLAVYFIEKQVPKINFQGQVLLYKLYINQWICIYLQQTLKSLEIK